MLRFDTTKPNLNQISLCSTSSIAAATNQPRRLVEAIIEEAIMVTLSSQ